MGNEMTTTATIVGTDGCSASDMHSRKPMNDKKTNKNVHEEQHNIVVFPIVHAEEQMKHNGVAYNLRRTSHSHNTNVCDEANETINKAAALCPAVAEALRQHELGAHHHPLPSPPVQCSNIGTTSTAQEVITIDDNDTRDSDSDNINAMTGKKHNVSMPSSKTQGIVSLQQQNSTSLPSAKTVETVPPRPDSKSSLKHMPTQEMSMTMPMPNPTSVKSAVAPPPPLPTTTSTNTTSSSHSCSISNKPLTFPQKLHLILSNPQLEGIIQWLPHGRAWKIIQVKTFEQKVLPLYFHHCKYTSFIRQVNAWGFRRITYHQYYHEMFVRGTPQLCAQMKRLNKEDMEKRKEEGNVAIPNFNLVNKENALKAAQQQPPSPHRYYSKSGTLNKSSAQIVMQYHDNTSQPLPPLMTTSSIPQHPQLQSPPSSSHYSRQPIMSQQQLLAQHSQRYPQQQQQIMNTAACGSQQSTMSKRERMIREQGRRLEQLRKKKTQAKKQGLSVTNAELVAALAMEKLGGGSTTLKTK